MPTGTFSLVDAFGPLIISTTASRSLGPPVTFVWGRVTDVQVTLSGLSHSFPDDLDFLLLGPRGTNLEFWSDAGGGPTSAAISPAITRSRIPAHRCCRTALGWRSPPAHTSL